MFADFLVQSEVPADDQGFITEVNKKLRKEEI